MLALGVWLGAGAGCLGGAGEALLLRLDTLARLPFVLGVDGLLGAAWGLMAAGLLLPFSGLRRRGFPAVTGALLAVVTFPLLAAGLGLFVNRVLLSGTHFLSLTSLLLDVVALIVAGALALALGRVLSRLLRATDLAPPPVLSVALLVIALAAAAALGGKGPARGAVDPARPDVVLVSIDTLRPDRLSIGGEPSGTSPAIDRLCREGVLFTEALAVSPGSAASHAALLTSRYPVSNGVWSNFTVMNPAVTTIAEILREQGYRTGGFVTNTFLGRRFGFDQGFDAYVESGVVERLEEPSPSVLRRSLAVVQIVDRIRGRLDPGYDPSFETALDWVRESDRPTFWFVHVMDVHSPYVPPHPYGPRFGATPEAGAGGRNRFGWRPSVEAYLAEIRFADSKMERLRRALEARGTLDDSVLILTSDHGENLVDHEPNFGHGSTLYDATVRILAAVRGPGVGVRPRLEPAPFENVDVLPTVASWLGWPRHPAWEGRDFATSAPADDPPLYSQLYRDFAARTRSEKVILKESGERQVFDLARDPGETRPVHAEPERRAQADSAMAAWLALHATDLYLEQAQTIRPDDLSPETVEKLRALGYIE